MLWRTEMFSIKKAFSLENGWIHKSACWAFRFMSHPFIIVCRIVTIRHDLTTWIEAWCGKIRSISSRSFSTSTALQRFYFFSQTTNFIFSSVPIFQFAFRVLVLSKVIVKVELKLFDFDVRNLIFLRFAEVFPPQAAFGCFPRCLRSLLPRAREEIKCFNEFWSYKIYSWAI